ALLALAVVVGGCASSSSSSPSTGTTAPLANTTTAPPLSATTTPASGSASASPRPAPDGDAFYTPPSPLPAGQPGDLIWARPFTGPANSQGYEVLYLSSTVDDQPVAVSGVVIVPGA